MRILASALAVAFACALGSAQAIACGGMTTVDPPPLTLDDPVAPPDFDEEDPEHIRDGDCIL